MSREAMKLALEALQKIYIAPEHEEYIRVWWPACEQAITALREALAEPQEKYIYGTPLLDAMTGKTNEALDKMAKNARELGLDYEPVWDNLPSNKDVEDAMRLKRLSQLAEQPAQQQEPVAVVSGYYGGQCVILPIDPARIFNSGTVLYTSPPAQRTWVGLTDEEIEAEFGFIDELMRHCCYRIEAKLREKNT